MIHESDGVRYAHYGVVATGSTGTLISNTDANTKGEWVELAASTDFTADGLWVFFIEEFSGVDSVIDIGLGAAGAERIIVPDLMWRGESASDPAHGAPTCFLPVHVPAGSRLAARLASGDAASGVRVSVMIQKGGLLAQEPLQRVTTYGVPSPLTSPYGTLIDPGATANAKGAWVQFAASLPFNVKGIVLDLGSATGTLTTARWSVDVGVGAAGSEVVRVADLMAALNSNSETLPHAGRYFIPVEIPAGSRIALRSQCSITDASDRLLYAVLHVVG